MLEAAPETAEPPTCLDNIIIIPKIMKWSFIVVARYIIIAFLLGLFLHQSYTALAKFQESKTSYHISLKEVEKILYPSVSVCKKYTFQKYIDNIFGNESLSLQDIIETANRESWDIQELFHFFSHPGIGV